MSKILNMECPISSYTQINPFSNRSPIFLLVFNKFIMSSTYLPVLFWWCIWYSCIMKSLSKTCVCNSLYFITLFALILVIFTMYIKGQTKYNVSLFILNRALNGNLLKQSFKIKNLLSDVEVMYFGWLLKNYFQQIDKMSSLLLDIPNF